MLASFSVKKPLTIVVFVLIIMILGVVSYTGMGVDLLPDMNIPYMVVITINPGASPDEVEGELTIPIENQLATVSGIKRMNSTSSEHYSMVIMELNASADLGDIRTDIESALKLVDFPDSDLLQDPIIMELNPSMLPVMQLSIGRTDSSIKESTAFFDSVVEKLTAINGVASISSSGLVTNMAYVNLSEDKTTESVVNYLAEKLNISLTVPDEEKESLRVELNTMLTDAENNPDLSDDGKISAEKVLDVVVIPYVRERVDAIGSAEENAAEEALLPLLGDGLVNALTEEGAVRSGAINALQILLDERFILEEGDENKQIFYDMVDELYRNSIVGVLGGFLTSMSGSITDDLLDQVLYAQNFNMPAGSVSLGASSYVVKIGDGIRTREELLNLPVYSYDLSTGINAYIENLQLILRLIAMTGEDGTASFTSTQVAELAEQLSWFIAVEDDYADWATDSITDAITANEYIMNDAAREAWELKLEADEGFMALVNGFGENPPVNWRTQTINYITANNLYPDNGTTFTDPVVWDEDFTAYYTQALDDELAAVAGEMPDLTDYDALAAYVVQAAMTPVASFLYPIDATTQAAWEAQLAANFDFQVAAATAEQYNTDYRKAVLNVVIDKELFPLGLEGATWTDGYTTYYKARLQLFVAALDATRPTDVAGYAQYVVSSLVPVNILDEHYLSTDVQDVWEEYIVANVGFNALITGMSEDADWRRVVFTYVKNHATGTNGLFPVGNTLRSAKQWDLVAQGVYAARIATLVTGYETITTASNAMIGAVGQETFDGLRSFFRGNNEREIEQTMLNVIDALDEYGGEGAVTKVTDESDVTTYTVNFTVLENTVEERREDMILPITLGSLSNIIFFDDASQQITTILTRSADGTLIASPAVQLSVSKEPDESTAEVTSQIKETLSSLQEKDEGFTYNILSDDGEYIDFTLNTVLSNLLFGGILAIIILLLFLKNIKATIVVGSSIIISVVFTFVMMYFAGITLNIVSMGGLALGVGMLVDNSIVVLENIFRVRAQGKDKYVAAIYGAKQVAGAIFASTATTMIVFLPIAFIEGLTKQLFMDMALTICFSLLSSLIVALTVVPMAASTSLKKNAKPDGGFLKKMKKTYAKALNFSLGHKLVVVLSVVVLLGVSVISALSLGTEFLPNMAMGYISVTCDISPEAINKLNGGVGIYDEEYYTYEQAESDVVNMLSGTLANYPDIKSAGIARTSGLSIAGMNMGGGAISATIMLVDEKSRTMSPEALGNDVVSALNSKSNGLFAASVSTTSLTDLAGLSGGETNVYVYGDDLEEMRAEVLKLADTFKNIEGISNVNSGIEDSTQEYKISVNKQKANAYGLTVAQVYLQISAKLATPSAVETVRVQNADDLDGLKQNVDIYIYSNLYTNKVWYEGTSGETTEKIYFENNVVGEGDFSKNTYWIENGNEVVYVKETTADGVISHRVTAGERIPLTRNGNQFSYEKAAVTPNPPVMVMGKIVNTTDVSYSTVTFTVEDFTEHYSVRSDEIDLVTMSVTSENALDPTAEKVTVPLYKLLNEESFTKDAGGNVIYRVQEGLETNVPLSIAIGDGYSSISHVERQKCVTMTLTYDAETYDEGAILAAVNASIAEYNTTKPASITATTEGGSTVMDEVFNTLYLVLAFAIVLIFLVMVAQFQSWKSPLIIMSTIPLAFTGSFLLLFLSGMKLSAMALVGLVILMGIVVNNGIVFVDYVNKLIEMGVPKKEAIIRTGLDRIRPILMTALTTIFAMLIMALDGSETGKLLQPMAVATIGGLTYATFVTLILVPVIYDIFNRKAAQSERTIALKQAAAQQVDLSEVDDVMDEEFAQVVAQLLAKSAEPKQRKHKRGSGVASAESAATPVVFTEESQNETPQETASVAETDVESAEDNNAESGSEPPQEFEKTAQESNAVECATKINDQTANAVADETSVEAIPQPVQVFDTAAEVPTETAQAVPTETVQEVPTETAATVAPDISVEEVQEVPTETAQEVPTETVQEVPIETAVKGSETATDSQAETQGITTEMVNPVAVEEANVRPSVMRYSERRRKAETAPKEMSENTEATDGLSLTEKPKDE